MFLGNSLVPSFPHLLLAAGAAAVISMLAFRTRALTRDGAVAACAVGTVVFGIGGWKAAAALVTFFVSSTLLSRWRRQRKEALGYEKGGRRDAGQVLANGGVAAVCLLLTLAGLHDGLLLCFAALAAANADTWATEVGSAAGGLPLDIRTGRTVRAGSSGAVSMAGTGAAFAGAALIGLFAGDAVQFLIVSGAGFGGALVDSLAGATVQAQWRDPEDPDRWTEKPQPGPPQQGMHGVRNDSVNLLCTLTAAGLAALLGKIIHPI